MSERTIETLKKRNVPELLAPVGGWAQLEAAVYNGADAVYMGGPLFNARMKADNFGGEKLKEAINFAHAYGVKVYITLNTLIKDSELQKAFDYTCDLYETGADAVILQDMGLARLIHKYIPDFPMHLSTQGTVYNRSGLEMAADLGFSRVVPARETSLEEIRTLCGNDRAEVEIFVHGALCMCYSGQCQMSRLLGGGSTRSGNRGLCAQPCRLQYTDDRGNLTYALSPKDICTLEDIPELCEAGVDSFKIEGRLKSPEYVATVTRIYRKYLDMYAAGIYGNDGRHGKKNDFAIEPQDIHDLLQIFNRGGFTKGYLHDNPGNEMLSGNSPKNQGVCVGEVVAVHDARGKGSREGRQLIDVKLARNSLTGKKETICMGDGIELSETGNVVTYLENIKSDVVRIGDFKVDSHGNIKKGENVFKVTDKELKERALTSAGRGMNGTAANRNNNEITMNFSATIGKQPALNVKADGKTYTIEGSNAIEKALKRPADPERIKEQLGKLGGTPLSLADIKVNVEKDAMVPVSVVNEMRRQAVDAILKWRRDSHRIPVEGDVRAKATQDINETIADIAAGENGGNRPGCEKKCADFALMPLEKFMSEKCREGYVPYVINVTKGNTDRYIRENFTDIVEAVKSTGIVLGNLGWIKEFRTAGVKVYGDYGLNVFNGQAIKLFEENEVDVIAWSDEMSLTGRHCSLEKGVVCEAPRRIPEEMNDIPLMITEHPLQTDFLTDRKGVKHKVMKWHSGDKDIIF